MPPESQPTPPTQQPQIRLSFQDILDGRAYIRLPLVAKLLLCHWAGAPWSDKNKKARLSAIQVETLARRERLKIVHGGSGLGKSVLGGCDLLCANMLPRRKVAVVAGRYDHVAHEFQYLYAGYRKLFTGMPQAFKRLVNKNQNNYHEFHADSIWGSETIGISTQSEDGAQLLGREYTDVVCGEASHVSPEVYNKRLLRASDRSLMNNAQNVGFISMYTTPKGFEGAAAHEWERIKKQTRNHAELLHHGAAPFAESAWVREADVSENPDYDRGVIEVRRRTLDKVAFAEQYQGKMTFAAGRVWRSFDDNTHVKPMPPREYIRGMRLGLGIDTGAFTGIVLGGIGMDGKRWILGEAYLEKPAGGIYTSLAEAEEMVVRVLGPVFGTERALTLLQDVLFLISIDPASQHKLEIIDRWDIGLTSPNTADQRSVLSTVDRVDQWFLDCGLFIVDECENLVDQIRKYVWKLLKAPTSAGAPVIREPSKGYDHLCDAMRFLMIPLDDYGIPTEPPPAITFQEAWESAQKQRIFGPLREALARGALMERMT
jgi:hypothetical protein